MPNHVTNRLEIHCEDKITMDKIRMMIFDEDENKKQKYTMSKMLPLPVRFSGSKAYSDYGYDWCRAIWVANGMFMTIVCMTVGILSQFITKQPGVLMTVGLNYYVCIFRRLLFT